LNTTRRARTTFPPPNSLRAIGRSAARGTGRRYRRRCDSLSLPQPPLVPQLTSVRLSRAIIRYYDNNTVTGSQTHTRRPLYVATTNRIALVCTKLCVRARTRRRTRWHWRKGSPWPPPPRPIDKVILWAHTQRRGVHPPHAISPTPPPRPPQINIDIYP